MTKRASVPRHEQRRRRLALGLVVLAALSLAADCDSTDVYGAVIVPASDATPPTVGLEVRRESAGDVLYTAPYVGSLVPTQGDWLLVSAAGDEESGIRAMELLTSTTTTVCPSKAQCRPPVTVTKSLDDSYERPKGQVGDRVDRSGLAGSLVEEDAFLPEAPPEGGSVTVRLDLYATATNHLDGQTTTPPISLSYSVGTHQPPPPPCGSFTLSWSWSREDYERTGEFVQTPSCPAESGAVVKDVKVSLQFDPNTETKQTVTVSHLEVKEVPILNGQSSEAFDEMDPAGEWTLNWGGNVLIHPRGLSLMVTTGPPE